MKVLAVILALGALFVAAVTSLEVGRLETRLKAAENQRIKDVNEALDRHITLQKGLLLTTAGVTNLYDRLERVRDPYSAWQKEKADFLHQARTNDASR